MGILGTMAEIERAWGASTTGRNLFAPLMEKLAETSFEADGETYYVMDTPAASVTLTVEDPDPFECGRGPELMIVRGGDAENYALGWRGWEAI